jgi:hypothetical protein
MKRLPQRAPRRGHTGKLERKATARETSKGTAARSADKVSLDFLMLRNVHDHLAVDKLRSTPVGALAVDRLVRNDPQMVPLMRVALIEVYCRAAQARELSRATKRQMSNAKVQMTAISSHETKKPVRSLVPLIVHCEVAGVALPRLSGKHTNGLAKGER